MSNTKDGKFIVRIFGINDNPKENRLFGRDLDEIEKELGAKLWENDSHTLWSAALYPEKDTIEEAVKAALNLYAIVKGEDQADLSAWREAQKKSLCSGFNDADPDAIIAWNKRMADLVAMDEIAKAIRNKVPAAKLRKRESLTKIQKEWLERRIRKADFSEKMRLHYYLGTILEDEDEVQECFSTIQSEVLATTLRNLSYNENARIVTEKHTVKLPLRVNWGGGWSDTPPYCNENGGTVLNVAILLNGQKPVEVTLEKLSEKKIVFDSHSTGIHCADNNNGGENEDLNKNLWSLQWCHFYAPSLPSVHEKYKERGGHPVFHPKEPTRFTDIFTDIYKLASSSDYIRDMRINEKLSVLLTLLMEQSWHPESVRVSRKRMELSSIKAFLDENYTEKIVLDDLAEKFFINKFYMSKIFKEGGGGSSA